MIRNFNNDTNHEPYPVLPSASGFSLKSIENEDHRSALGYQTMEARDSDSIIPPNDRAEALFSSQHNIASQFLEEDYYNINDEDKRPSKVLLTEVEALDHLIQDADLESQRAYLESFELWKDKDKAISRFVQYKFHNAASLLTLIIY
jgi:hypothetical protein